MYKKAIRKPVKKIGNAAARAAGRELRILSRTNPISDAGYKLAAELVRQVKKGKKKEKRSRDVEMPAVQGTVRSGSQFSVVSKSADSRVVKGSETFLSIYRPSDSSYDDGGIFDISTKTSGLINLAKEAANYQMYRFTSVEVTYEPVGSTQTRGSILFGCLADPTDPAPVSLEEARAVKESISTPVWQKTTLKIETDNTYRYVSGDQVSLSDVRLQVFKRMFVGSTSVTVGEATGLFTMTYKCELKQRKPSTDSIGSLELDFNGNFSDFNTYTGTKSNPWFKIKDGKITFMCSGRFKSQLAIRIDNDLAIPGTSFTLNGGTVPVTLGFQADGFVNNAYVNKGIGVFDVSFILRTNGAELDLSSFNSIPSSGSVMISIDKI